MITKRLVAGLVMLATYCAFPAFAYIVNDSFEVESPIHEDIEHPGTRFRVVLPIGESSAAAPQVNGVDEIEV
jgi:hypothetical protein